MTDDDGFLGLACQYVSCQYVLFMRPSRYGGDICNCGETNYDGNLGLIKVS